MPPCAPTLIGIEILVVCTGNTCRSPMAAALLHDAFSGAGMPLVRARSVGTLGWSGRPATSSAVDALAEIGVDLSAHISTKLSGADIASADIVLAMTRVHAGAVLAHDPAAAERTFLLPELARLASRLGAPSPDEPIRTWAGRAAASRPRLVPIGRAGDEIDDPAGHPIEVYRATRDLLRRHIETLVREWAGQAVVASSTDGSSAVGAVGAQPPPHRRL